MKRVKNLILKGKGEGRPGLLPLPSPQPPKLDRTGGRLRKLPTNGLLRKFKMVHH
jgi:hypothetical protein